ncbi:MULTISPECIES: nuclear transport factor 2 family protein [unclassified Microbacterium]|uniref:nuclear transport factor 2 family protein n=1 Tax=unclassified Microbacterium TaxID=2609290 RepID=UPI000D56732E|nr:nuclear transport factor 2 family protein [Microbacterium sp. Gd 4-13]PVW03916.1 nuclear transport factor 2 family protein [Microbacterium sp. Gd 4-13]
MDTITPTPHERFEILDLVHRYSTGIDTRDWALFASTFTDDAHVDFGFAQWEGAPSFTAFMRETHDPAGRTLHRMTNTVVTGIDPLTARTYGDAIVLQPDNVHGTIANAWYDDEIVRTPDGLRIRRRVVHMISMRAIGPNLVAEM